MKFSVSTAASLDKNLTLQNYTGLSPSAYPLSSPSRLYADSILSFMDPHKPGSRLYEVDGQLFLPPKTLAELLGEKFLALVVDYVSDAFIRLKTVTGGMYQAALWVDSYFQFPAAEAYSAPGPKVSVESEPGVWEELETTMVSSAKRKRMRLLGDADGIGGEFRVNTYTLGGQMYPSITALSDGGFVVVWSSEGQDGSGYGIYLQRYDDTLGNKVGSESLVNTYTQGDQIVPSIASLQNGGFVVVWHSNNQDGFSWGIYLQRYDVIGNKINTEFRANSYTQGPQYDAGITALTDGGFAVVWDSYDQYVGSSADVYLQRYDNSGEKIGTESLVNTYLSYPQYHPKITHLLDGGSVWRLW